MRPAGGPSAGAGFPRPRRARRQGQGGLEVEFRYGALGWHAGTASGSQTNGFCAPGTIDVTCYPAVAGFDLGDVITGFQIPSSGTATVQDDLPETSNIGVPGVWNFVIPAGGGGLQVCGDGLQGPCEICDDGNTSNNDGCLNDCTLPTCGDGFTRTGVEECDDANTNNNDACLNNCVAARCGDGILRTGVEACDDGNTNNNDGCTNACAVARCGDGIVQTGVESCDDGNASNTDACLNSCVNASCGDGFTRTGVEQCDDGNLNKGDGCGTDCKVEAGFRCTQPLLFIGPSVCYRSLW